MHCRIMVTRRCSWSIFTITIYKIGSIISLRLWGSWDMSALWLKTVLVSDVADLVGLSVISNERVRSFYNQSLVLMSSIQELCFLLPDLAVTWFEAEFVGSISNVGLVKVLDDHWGLLLLNLVRLLVLWLMLILILYMGEKASTSHGQESGENDELKQ